jgi:polyisoprenoid-binding protein YceI
MKNTITLLIAIYFVSFPAFATEYKVNTEKSEIVFTGKHAGNEFNGKFEKWSAEINYNAEDISKSSIKVTINPSSAKTGNAMYDGTLPTADWFAVEQFSEANFVSKNITKNDDNSFKVDGILTIRNIAVPVNFTFKLQPEDLSSNEVTTVFSLTVNRLDFDIGKKSDEKADWVSKEIKLNIKLFAEKI